MQKTFKFNNLNNNLITDNQQKIIIETVPALKPFLSPELCLLQNQILSESKIININWKYY